MRTQQFGQGMMVMASVVALGLLTVYFGGVEKRQYNPNQNPESRENQLGALVELKRNRYGHYVASGTINDQNVEFLLDTGATDVVIPVALAIDLGLKKGRPSIAYTANGSVTVYGTQIEQLTIGKIVLNNVRASINPGMDRTTILLGMSALKQIEFLQKGDSLTLRQIY
ncbi:MAG: aspartyl protease family protein [Candidatus Azotimanducaceae bacterium]